MGIVINDIPQRYACEQLRQEPPEPPPHVMANLDLSYELETEYLNGKDTGFKRRVHPQSSTARKRGAWYTNFYEVLANTIKEIEDRLPAAKPRPDNYETAMEAFGATWGGCSEVMPRMKHKKTVLHGE